MWFLYHLGRYFIFMAKVSAKPEKYKIYYRQTLHEIESLGVNSIGIVLIISVFIGAVITIQTAYNIQIPLIPKYVIGVASRDSMMLEFSSTIVGLILAGKVGSNIASEIGTMRVTEQIDALEIMGVNSASYVVLPKIIATVVFNPLLTLMSVCIGIFGGWVAGTLAGVVTSEEYIYGIQYLFIPWYVTFTMCKAALFAFLMSSISAYMGYHVSGGSVDVGKSSTRAVVFSSIAILFFNLLLTQMFLS